MSYLQKLEARNAAAQSIYDFPLPEIDLSHLYDDLSTDELMERINQTPRGLVGRRLMIDELKRREQK